MSKKLGKEKAKRVWEVVFEHFYELANGEIVIRDTNHGLCPVCGEMNELDSFEKQDWLDDVDRVDFHGTRAYVPDDIKGKGKKILKDFNGKIVHLPAKLCPRCRGKKTPQWKADTM